MNTDLIIPLLVYCGMAFCVAVGVVLVQAVLLDLTSRQGRWVIPMMPFAVVLGVLLTGLFSGRNLKFMTNDGTGAEVDVAWVSRSISVTLLALAIAKIVVNIRTFRRLRSVVAASDAQHRSLYIAFVAFFLGLYAAPMAFSAHPSLTYKGLFAFALFTAVYVCRREPLGPVITATKLSLLAVMVGSLLAAAIKPSLALESNYVGVLPGAHSRLWGLASHANALGAMALLLLLLQWFQPFARRIIDLLVWTSTLAVLVLAQSKTAWLAGVLTGLVLVTYRHGLEPNGRPRLGFVAALMVGASLLSVGGLFVNVEKLWLDFQTSNTGAGLANLTGRTEIWAAAWRMWLDSPAFGYGLDAWSFMHRMQLGMPFAVHAHNQLMQALSVGGLVAAVPWLVYFFLLARASIRAARRTQGVSLALFVFIAMRCVSEAPMDLSGVLSGEFLCQFLLFMIVVHEGAPETVRRSLADPTREHRPHVLSAPIGSA